MRVHGQHPGLVLGISANDLCGYSVYALSMPDVRRLQVLREVAAHGSFSAAAEALAFTQPAVSRQIATLEAEAGARLVDRSVRGVRLTQAGELLVGHADAILARLAAAESQLEALAQLEVGRLRIGSPPTASATLIPLAIAAFAEAHPDVDLRLDEALSSEPLPRLASGELDIAIVTDANRSRAAGRARARAPDGRPVVPGAPAGHPLADGRPRADGGPRGRGLDRGPPRGVRRAAARAAPAAGFEPRIASTPPSGWASRGSSRRASASRYPDARACHRPRRPRPTLARPRTRPRRTIFLATIACGGEAPAVAPMREILRRVAAEHGFSSTPETPERLTVGSAAWQPRQEEERPGSRPGPSATPPTPERPTSFTTLSRRAGPAALHGGRPAGAGSDRPPGRVSVHARRLPDDVPRAVVDDAAVRGLRDGGGDQRALPLSARSRADRALDRVRHAVADGPRLRPRALAGRGRARGRGDRHARRHGDAVRRHRPRQGHRCR